MQNLMAAILGILVATPSVASAQMTGHDHGKTGMGQPAPMSKGPQAAKSAEGEVRKVDAANGTVVLKHGPLESLGMPPMTMEFKATDPKVLAKLKQGDKVKFTPEQGKGGELLVSSIEVIK